MEICNILSGGMSSYVRVRMSFPVKRPYTTKVSDIWIRNFCGDSPNIIFRATVYPVSPRLKEKITVPVILRLFFFYRESFNMRSHFHLHVKFDTQNHLLFRGNVPLLYTINTKSLYKILHTTIKPQN
jgi:hypothetical protein